MGKNMQGDNRKRLLCTRCTVLIGVEKEEDRKKIYEGLFAFGISTDEAGDKDKTIKLLREHAYDLVLFDESISEEEAKEAAGSRLSKPDETDKKDMPIFIPASAVLSEDADWYALLERNIPEDKRQYIEEEENKEGYSQADVVPLFMVGVDVVTAIKQYDTVDDFLDLLEVFYVDGQKRRGSLEEKIFMNDLETFTIEVHGLKSAAANIGAFDLSELAKKHEAAGNAKDKEFIEARKEDLFEIYEKVLSEIERVLKRLEYGKFAKKDNSALKQLAEGELKERLQKIYDQIDDFHPKDAAKDLEELMEYAMPDEVRTGLEEVQTMLRMYEDDNAQDKVKEIIEGLD